MTPVSDKAEKSCNLMADGEGRGRERERVRGGEERSWRFFDDALESCGVVASETPFRCRGGVAWRAWNVAFLLAIAEWGHGSGRGGGGGGNKSSSAIFLVNAVKFRCATARERESAK